MMDELKDRLVYIRKKRGFKTQESLAAATENVSRATIANIESGRFGAQPIVLAALCRTLNINSDWLQYGKGPVEPDQPEESDSEVFKELVEVCSTLKESEQLFLLDTIKAMQKHIIQKES